MYWGMPEKYRFWAIFRVYLGDRYGYIPQDKEIKEKEFLSIKKGYS